MVEFNRLLFINVDFESSVEVSLILFEMKSSEFPLFYMTDNNIGQMHSGYEDILQ